jgi:threonylcarbamoyladenosine tRNA methylthiotransferase MtaB
MSNAATTVRFQTVGCRLNQYETERMAAALIDCGLERVDDDRPADLYVINTCTVTHRADRDCRYLARKARRDNPAAKVVLVGCYVETDREKVAGLDEVDAIIGNDEKEAIAELLAGRWPELFVSRIDSGTANPGLSGFHARNRAWIKVSDGCNQRCSYCLVTVVRGPLRCRPASELIAEIRELAAHGYREVVLTAVNMGYYRDPEDSGIDSFARLVAAVLEQVPQVRLRLSSIEPQTVTDELLNVYSQAPRRVCRHWHIPLQSGSDRILKMMRRPYSVDKFIERARAARQAVAGAVVGADVIVGFPGETEEDFAEGLALADSGLLDYLHVFSYSDRPGTPAAELPDKVSPQVIRDRVERLKAVSGRRWRMAHEQSVGQTLDVICENRMADDGRYRAVADNYLRVRMPEGTTGGRRVYRVRLTRAAGDYAEAEIIA